MYKTDFICTYNLYDFSLNEFNPLTRPFAETIRKQHGEYGEEERKEIADYLYKNELLHALGLTIYDNEKLRESIDEIERATQGVLSFSIDFVLLFSYDCFHITHLCLCDFFKEGAIQEENRQALYNRIVNL
jgi:hypothetical protein